MFPLFPPLTPSLCVIRLQIGPSLRPAHLFALSFLRLPSLRRLSQTFSPFCSHPLYLFPLSRLHSPHRRVLPSPPPLISPASPAPAKTSSTSGSSFPPSSNGRFSAKTAGKPCSPAPPTRSTATASSASAAPSRGSPSSSSTALSGRPSPWYPRGSRLTARKARRRSFRTPSPWKPSTPTPRSSPSGVPRFHRPPPRRPSSAPSPATPPNWRAASASPRACFPVSPF